MPSWVCAGAYDVSLEFGIHTVFQGVLVHCADTNPGMRLQNHGRVAAAILQHVFCKRTRHGETRKDVVWFRILWLAWQRSGRDAAMRQPMHASNSRTRAPEKREAGSRPRDSQSLAQGGATPAVECRGRAVIHSNCRLSLLIRPRDVGKLRHCIGVTCGTRKPEPVSSELLRVTRKQLEDGNRRGRAGAGTKREPEPVPCWRARPGC